MGEERFRALVVGCGRIGAIWDKPGQAEILTHAHAYHAHPGIGELGFVDQDPGAARRAAELWGGTAYPDLESALAAARPQIASVCTPDASHFAVLDRLLESPVRLILAEKPLALAKADAGAIVARARARGIAVNVNYSRRFDPVIAETRAALRRGDFGKPLNAIGCYAKGILHNGSHLIDMLRYLLGEVEGTRVLAARSGHGAADPTLDCWLRMQGCPSVHLVGLSEECYSVHELDLFCERARLRFTRFGFDLETQTVEADPLFPGYRELSRPAIQATGLARALGAYLEDGLRALVPGGRPACPAEDAAATLGICLDLLEKYRKEECVG
jgi:predicted dehydrogenase